MGISPQYITDNPMLPSFKRPITQTVRHAFLPIVTLCGMLLLAAPLARADDFADVSKFIRNGQFSEALAKVDAALAQHPQDAQMRFLKGLILTEQNKAPEAIAIFTKLTEDFPKLPEPYNNLAVLYASSGQYDKARAALEKAIHTNPTYATAHENLGDVYAKLASQAYDKALQLDSGNSGAKSKLTLVRTLVGSGGATGAKPSATAPAPAPAVAAARPGPTPPPQLVAKAELPKPEPKTVAKASAKVETKVETKVEAKPEPKAAQKSEPKADERDDVLKAVNNWAKAWSSKDVKTYLASYGQEFQTPKGESRKAWAEERRARIEGKGRISVQVESPQVKVDGDSATVRFHQSYTSDRLSAKSKKVLVLEKQRGKWQIQQERTAN